MSPPLHTHNLDLETNKYISISCGRLNGIRRIVELFVLFLDRCIATNLPQCLSVTVSSSIKIYNLDQTEEEQEVRKDQIVHSMICKPVVYQ